MTLGRTMIAALVLGLSACSSNDQGDSAGTGGSPGAGGASSQGGTTASGGATGSGGQSGTGGTIATGGRSGSGGTTAAGGQTGSGGRTAGRSGSGGTTAEGGTTSGGGQTGFGGTTGGSGGMTATGGQTGSGGASATGGRGGRDAGRDAPQGTGGSAGTGGSSGTGGGGGSPGDAGGAIAVKPSAGCGKTPTLLKSTPPPNTKINYNKIGSRQYILWYPDNYDNNHPYRLVFAFHWMTGSASQVFDCNTESIKCYTTQSPFYGHLKLANDTTIFIAPDGLNAGWANTNGQDVTFTDDMLKQVSDDLCIDMNRVFTNGFSYGAGMSFALACARPDVFRAVGIYAGGQLSGCSGGNSPVAYYATHGLDDGTLNISGGRTMRDKFVKLNGCTPQDPPEPAKGSGTHTCTTYQGCSEGHPVEWCAFAGSNGHDPSPKDPGQSTTWNPAESWKFFTQF
jgi:poly(3-hydroxybutyrate) depolymerase